MEDNLKISQMPPVETATGEEMIPCVTGDPKENKSVTVSKIRQGMVKDENYVHTDNNFTTQLKDKLDGIEKGAQKNTVIGVKGNAEQSYRTGNVNITKDNIGLSNVDNTSDAEKPVSTAQRSALDKKVDKVDGKALSTNDFTNDYKTLLEQIKMQQGNMYGVEMRRGQIDPVFQTWIGKEEFKSSHPILNSFRVAKVKDGKVVGFLDQTNFFKMADGSPSNIVITSSSTYAPEIEGQVEDDGSDIMLVNTKSFWVINGGTDDTYERRLVGDAPFTYGGDTAIEIKPFGMSIGYSTIKEGKQRSIIDYTIQGSASAGNLGVNIMEGNGWPTTSESRFDFEKYARNKNGDTTKNYPYANAFALDLEVWCTLLFIKFRTKDLHSQSVCGKGISSNDSAPDASSWGKMTGVRFKKADGQTYVYYKLNGQGFKASETGTAYNFSQLINNYRPCMKMFEAQLAMSYAKEHNVSPDTEFEYESTKYKYYNFQGHNGLADGEMSGIVAKFVTATVTSGWSIPDNAAVTDREIEICFTQPIIRGRIAGWGDIWMWYSGIDCVMHDSTSIDIYQTYDVNNLTTDNVAADKNPGESYGFENTYDFVGSMARGEGYITKNFENSLIGEVKGSNLHTGECHYNWFTGNAGSGKIGRRGVCFGGRSSNVTCSLRSGYLDPDPSSAGTFIGGGFRCTITQP